MPTESNESCVALLTNVVRALKSSAEPERVYQGVLDLTQKAFRCRSAAIVLVDPATEYLKIETAYGISHTYQKSFRKRISTGAIGNLLWAEQPVVIEDGVRQAELAEQVRLEEPFGSCVCMPMSADHRTVGYLYAALVDPGTFTPQSLAILQACADCAALALHKSRLAEENLRLNPVDKDTGLEKYFAFKEHLKATLDRALRFHEPFSLILGDVDNFKTLNHTYGYSASNQLLKEMAGIIGDSLRVVDAAARFGFDEFIILRANSGLSEAVSYAEMLCESIRSASFTPSRLMTTVSIGVASFPESGRTTQEVLLAAKQAMFESQRTGRDKVMGLSEPFSGTQRKVINSEELKLPLA